MPTHLVVNAHGGGGTQSKAFAKWYKEINPDIGYVSELEKNDDELRDAGYYVFTGHGSIGKEDTGIVVPKPVEHLITQEYIEQLTQNFHRKVAPARFYTNIAYKNRSTYSIHANAVIQNKRTDGWLDWKPATAWFRAMGEINQAMFVDERLGLAITCGGDFNWHHSAKIVPRSPEWLAKKRHLDYVVNGTMWMMWSKKEYDKKHVQIIQGETIPTGVGDQHPHNALLVTLERIN